MAMMRGESGGHSPGMSGIPDHVVEALRELRDAGGEKPLARCRFSWSDAAQLLDLNWITIDPGPLGGAWARLTITARIHLASLQ